MFDKLLFRSLATAAALAMLAAPARAEVIIETVPVGNPGNGNDTRYETPGYGSVADPYLIGQYEVTAGQYCEFLNAVADTDTYGLYNPSMDSSDYGCQITRTGSSGSYTYDFSGRPGGTTEADWVNRPVNYVSWGDAARFCNWLHNGQPIGPQGDPTTEDGAYDLNGATGSAALMAITRETDATWFIPTENQWYKAAYHKNDGVTNHYWDYPTQADDPNVPSNDLIDPDPGNNANFYQDGGYTIGSPYWTTEVGEFENSESAYDTFDQGGNLWEWNETAVSGSSRGLRGGLWGFDSPHLFASLRGSGFYPAYEDFLIGFRVASVPEPGSITLVVCGLIAGLMWWRRRK